MKYNIDDIERIEGEMLNTKMVADILGVDLRTFRKSITQNPNSFDFPVIKIGRQFRIPKTPFLNYIKGNSNKIA